MGQVIAVTGRGGAGKTTLSANISYALSNMDKKVLLMDCDCGMRTVDLIFGLQDKVVYNFYDVAADACTISDACLKLENGLKIMPAPCGISCDELDFSLFSQLIEKVKNAYDYVFLDCTASLCTGLEKIISLCDTLLIVSECSLRCARFCEEAAQRADKYNIKSIYLVINKLTVDKSEKNDIIDSDELLKITGITPIGVCPYEDRAFSAVNDKKSRLGKACVNIASRLTGNKVPILYAKKHRIFR